MHFINRNRDRIAQSSWVGAESGNLANHTSTHSIHRIRQRIQIRIPSKYTQEPIISTLTDRHEIEVNIKSALLASNSQESGWFDLELYGMPSRIQEGLDYLAQLQIEIWDGDSFALGARISKTDWSFF
jgi:NIL domain